MVNLLKFNEILFPLFKLEFRERGRETRSQPSPAASRQNIIHLPEMAIAFKGLQIKQKHSPGQQPQSSGRLSPAKGAEERPGTPECLGRSLWNKARISMVESGAVSPTLNSNPLPWDRISPAHNAIRKAQDEALALKISGWDFHGWMGGRGCSGKQKGTRISWQGLILWRLFVLSCFISLVWRFTDGMRIERKISVIACEPRRRQPQSSCQTNLLQYQIITIMRYLSASQTTGSDIRGSVPNHRLCPSLPGTGNTKDSWFPLVGRDWVKVAPVIGVGTHDSVLLDCPRDRHQAAEK